MTRIPSRRRGIILLVLLLLLTLFALVGLAFVFYAQSRADAGRVYREAQQPSLANGPDMSPEILLDDWMRQFLFDVADEGPGSANSALRGHSLARTMYGGLGGSTTAFSGTGRLHATSVLGGEDDYFLINYQHFARDVIRRPEVFGDQRVGFNASYTYPDLNNMFLAAVRADGTVLQPSYHRSWTGFGPLGPQNPNWTSNTPSRYRVLRPRPQDMGLGFPAPADDGGDVKNLIGSAGGNDSIWMDIGSPIGRLPDGRLYKPLFAALVVDLDNRVNLNVHGNVRGAGDQHLSNQGIGPWEVNLQAVLNRDSSEWKHIFRGNGDVKGRYSSAAPNPGPGAQSVETLGPRIFYNKYDLDGGDEVRRTSSGRINFAGMRTPGVAFPTFGRGYGSGSAAELDGHPGLFNVFAPAGGDQTLSVANLKGLLYDGATGNDIGSDVVGKLCPQNLDRSAAGNRRRHLVTTLSNDVDAPGATPWISAPESSGYELSRTARIPQGPPLATVARQGGEFGPAGQHTLSPMGRLDLHRPLTPYPAPGSDGRFDLADPATQAQHAQAERDRQTLAGDIFVRLVRVTGAFDPFAEHERPPTQAEFDALRWLAQLSANMVDFIDGDDIMTPFHWTGISGIAASFASEVGMLDPQGQGWVFGSELPRLVINEAYAQIDNDTGDPKGLSRFNVDFYAELHNPFFKDAGLFQEGAAALQMGQSRKGAPGYAVHQFLVTRPNGGMYEAGNVRGDPDDGGTLLTVADYSEDVTASPRAEPGILLPGGATAVRPATRGRPYTGVSGRDQIYYVLGPGGSARNAAIDCSPGLPVTLPVRRQTFTDVAGVTYESGMNLRLGQSPTTIAPLLADPPAYALLLRRLANPHLPPNPTLPGTAERPYNPYITVDILERLPAFDGVQQINGLPHQPRVPLNARTSFGRREPYAARNSQLAAQTLPIAGQPMNTFYRPNAPLATPCHWLMHLDRQPISPMEMLLVSAFKPHELTQQFVDQQGKAHRHTAPWYESSTRLYRLFEFLETHSRAAGVRPGGRIPGKININTIWDPETFRALCDRQNSNAFTAADVDRAFNSMLAARTPASLPVNGILVPQAIGPQDEPFVGMAAAHAPVGDGQYPNGSGINNTMLRAAHPSGEATSPRLFDVPGQHHPYLRNQLLNKVYNQVTTRSNVFAVWLTVGFFEVTDETSKPVKLGAEINLGSGTNVRHRMFAIVDRTTMGIPGERLAKSRAAIAPGRQMMRLQRTNDEKSMVPGTVVMVDSGRAAESVVVQAVEADGFLALFQKPHRAGCPIRKMVPGNPGPQPAFSVRDSGALVPYVTVID